MGDQRTMSNKSTAKSTAAFFKAIKAPGMYRADPTLYLCVAPGGSKSWVQRLSIYGRRHDLGLGGFPLVKLAEARAKAFDNRKLARAGGDPLALKSRQNIPTFAAAAESVITMHEVNWRDERSAQQWRASLRDYAMPKLGRMRVDTITSADVMAVLLPIWNTKRETARRVRQRIGAVMKWSIAQGFRTDNPAGDAIGAVLPKNGVIKNISGRYPMTKWPLQLQPCRPVHPVWRQPWHSSF